MQAFFPGIFVGFILAIFMAPDRETEVVEVYPESYFKQVDIQESICVGPLDVEVVGRTTEVQKVVNLDNL